MKRRGAQSGTLSVRGPSWVISFRHHVIDIDGTMRYAFTRKVVGVAVGPDKISKQDARTAANAIMSSANDSAVPQLMATLAQFVQVFFVPGHVAHLRPAGRAHYDYLLKVHVLPTLGDLQLREITPGRVQLLLTAKAATLSQQTVVHVRNVLSAIFGHAKVLGYWRGDKPTEGVKCHGAVAPPQQSLGLSQLRALTSTIDARYQPLVALLGSTGLRIGEALGLQWKWVNMTDEHKMVDGLMVPAYSLAVVQSFSRGQWGKLKTPRSRRIVPLSSTAWVALTQMRERNLEGDDVVFAARTGVPFDAHNIAKRFLKPAAKAIGAPWCHWHTLRHTAISLPDLDAAARQKILGHTAAQTTTLYTHPEIERVRAALERVN